MNSEIYKILGKVYGLKQPKKSSHSCYIGEILSLNCKKSIGAHSISRGNNLDSKTWYSWEHDERNIENKLLFNDFKKLKLISDSKASVTHTICWEHDSNFAKLFEKERIVDKINTHHLTLLSLRTFINFHATANQDNDKLKKKLNKLLEEKKNLTDEKDIEVISIISQKIQEKISENEIILNNKLVNLLDSYIKNFWEKNYTSVYLSSSDLVDVFPLFKDLNFLIIPLKKQPTIVGSFFINIYEFDEPCENDYNSLMKTLQSTENVFEDEQDIAINRKFADEGYDDEENENNTKYEELISVHILKNGNDPFIVFQCFNSSEQTIFLHKLFLMLKNDKENFSLFLANCILLHGNIFFEESFVQSLTEIEHDNLKNCHNEKDDYLEESLFNKIKKIFF